MSHTSLYMHKEVFIMPKPKTVKKVRAIAGILYTDSAQQIGRIGLLICT